MLEFRKVDFNVDLETCLEFRKDSFVCSFPENEAWKERWDPEHYAKWVQEFARKFPLGVLHVWSNGAIIGQLEFEYGEMNGHIYLYYLRIEYRGTDIARSLQEYVTSELKARGCNTATLRVSPSNSRAISYYKKHGWKDLGLDQERGNVHTFKLDL